MKRFIRFMEFVLGYKTKKLVKKLSDQELLSLYYAYAPAFWKAQGTIYQRAMGGVVVLSVVEEFKRRYPHKQELQAWDYSEQINLYDLIMGGKSQ